MAWFGMLALVLVLVESVQAYGSGAPSGVCDTMTPKHGADPQTEQFPYHFAASSMDNGDIEVIIEASSEDNFRGFMVQPRQEDNKTKIVKGEFTVSSDSKVVDCNDNRNFLTHTKKNNKTKLLTKWTPPPGFEGNIVMRATVLRTAKVFWTNIDSSPLSVSKRESSVGTSTGGTPSQGKNGLSNGGCGREKSCFGMPRNCDEMSTCEILLSYGFDPSINAVEFEIVATTGSSTRMWIAAGISEDSDMGDDSVADCILADGQPSFYYSWNQRRSNSFGKNPEGLEALEATADDGILRCRWKRPISTVENGKRFDMLNETYYILLAKGSLREGNIVEKAKHSVQQASESKVNLTSISVISGSSASASLVKLHGCLMIIAWVGFVSVGILLARHYKDVWDEKTLCSVKIWFAFHRGLMVLSVSTVLIAFIIIFVHVGGWSSSATAHAVFGCISTVLAVLQPVGALFRPGPKDPKRPVFNWAHWSGGNIAQLAAFIAIFLAVKIPAANLQSDFTWAFAIFIAYHCLFHLLFQVYVWQVEKKKTNEISMMEISGDKKNEPITTGEKFKKMMLAIYTFPVAGLVVTLLFIIGLQ